jgi:hypothetical protein
MENEQIFPSFCKAIDCAFNKKDHLIHRLNGKYECSDGTTYCPPLQRIVETKPSIKDNFNRDLVVMSAFIKYVNEDISLLTQKTILCLPL